ncbi:transport and Golgi organization protein 1 homolog isoform X1 [Trachemys scripta elegans]|uniref:transport and Golgi organization protein 1 homolog isoform X1 n=1 Tax=Trachemys scripta elegans TaxID=31138 RepID=UPI001553D952|nr:transport and Golgi organization protein 1 homolog isoform X1 [Trachemys scripta elegans]
MAAAQLRFSLLLLALVALLLPAQRPLCLAAKHLDRRFAERKRCADPECSMLMYRGKAKQDFKGPDCRFINLKEGEAVYVYYKLIGKSTELWAGSVGSEFGYFPKDLLEINYIYNTSDELELPTDETDFVCFDGGKDNFDNYNVDELLKSSEETAVNRGKAELNAPGTEVVEETKEEEETEGSNTVKPLDVSETDVLEPVPEENKKGFTKTEEKVSFLSENTENVQGLFKSERDDLNIYSHEKKSQGDQIAHPQSEGMLQEKLKVLESENAKKSNNPQGTAKESDKESEEIDAYTLLNRELSMDLKTKFGSTADALVSDDEMTSLVTSLEDDFNEDLNTDSHDTEWLEDLKEQSEEIPLLSFTKEETPVDSEASKYADHESEKNKPYETIEDAAELITQRNNEKKDYPGLLTTVEDTIFPTRRGGARTNDDTDVSKSDSMEEKEEEDEVIPVSKEDKTEAKVQLEDLTEEDLLKKEKHVVDGQDPKEKTNKTKQYEEEFMDDKTESFTEELHSTSVHDPSAIPSLESKLSIEEKQEALKPPVGNIKDDPEGITLHKILKDKEKAEEEILEDSLENDTKPKTLWKKIKGKKASGDQQSINFLPEPLEERKSASQSHLGDIDLLEGKREHETSATEKQDIQQNGEDFEQTRMPENENQTNVAVKEETEILRGKKEEDPNNQHTSKGAVEQSKQQENKTRYSEEDAEQELSRNTGKKTLEKSIGEIATEEISTDTTQDVELERLTQQDTAHSGDENKDKALGTDIVGEKTVKPEFLSEELEAEEDDDLLSQAEEELLDDDNAASAKLSKERLANRQGNKLDGESTNPELEIPDGAISGTATPVYEIDESGEEANTTFKHARKNSMQDLSETKNEEEDIQLSGAKLNEMEEDEESPETEERLVAPEVEEEDERTLPNDKSLETVDSKNDFNQTEDPLLEDLVQKDLKDIQNVIEQTGPADTSVTTNEAVEPGYREAVKQLTIMKEFLDEKRVARLQKYLGPEHIVRVEAMFHNMKLKLDLAQKGNHDYEDIEQALDQILTFSESRIMEIVEHVLDARQAENKEEVVKEIDLWDEEAALMDDVQELIYLLRHKYSSVSESEPLVSVPEHEKDYSMPITDTVKETEYDSHLVGSSSSAEEIGQKFPQVEDERPVQHTEEEEEALKLREPEPDMNIVEEVGLLDKKETQEILDTEKGLSVADTSLGPIQSNREDLAAGIVTTADDTVKIESPHLEADPAVPHITLNDVAVLAKENMRPFRDLLVATLPEDIRPGPDFHGLPWEPIIITALVGIATLGILFWRTCLSVKSRMYQVTEKQLAEKIKNLLQEKTEILEKMSEYDQKIKAAKESVKVAQKQNTSLSDEAAGLKDVIKGLEETNHLLDDRLRNLHTMLETERQQNVKKEDKIFEMQKSLEKLQEVIMLHSVELSEVQIVLNEAKLSEEKVKSELRHVQEENARLKKRKEQLLQEAEGWSERHTELSEQIKLYQKSQKDIEEALAYKENEIEVLTNCIMQLKQFDADSEAKKDGEGNGWDTGDDLANGELPDNRSEKMKNQIKQMMDVSRVKTTLSIVEEDRDLLQSKLSDEIAARHELEEQIKKLEHDSCSLQTAKARFENECKTLQQKVEILNELYQQKEMALQKKLTQEEYERQKKEQKLSAADEKAVLAVEEVKVYKQRILEMEEELKKTERSYKNQIAGHEKKAHDNWLIARSAERALAEEKREAANLRQKLIEVNQKIAMLQRPLIVKPTAGRPDRQVPARRGPLSRDGSFGPSPVSGGGPSPPLMMEAPGQPLSATRREGSRSEFVDGPSAPRRPPELSGRSSVPDLGPAVAALVNSGPRTSSPSTSMDGVQNPPKDSEALCVSTVPPSSSEAAAVNLGPKGPPSFPGTPIMTSPVTGPPPPPIRFGALPPPLRGHYGSRPLPLPLVRGPPPPAARDYLPGPPLGMRDVPPGPLPPPDPRGYVRFPPPFRPGGPLGPRDYPPGPRLPPQGLRDYPPPPSRDLPPPGSRDYPPAPPCPPSPAGPRDYTHPPEQKP